MYYRQRISAAGSNSGKRWSTIRDVLHQVERSEANFGDNCQALCNKFSDYFVSKITKIKASIAQQLAGLKSDPTASDVVFAGEPLAVLSPPTVDEVAKIIACQVVATGRHPNINHQVTRR